MSSSSGAGIGRHCCSLLIYPITQLQVQSSCHSEFSGFSGHSLQEVSDWVKSRYSPGLQVELEPNGSIFWQSGSMPSHSDVVASHRSSTGVDGAYPASQVILQVLFMYANQCVHTDACITSNQRSIPARDVNHEQTNKETGRHCRGCFRNPVNWRCPFCSRPHYCCIRIQFHSKYLEALSLCKDASEPQRRPALLRRM